MVAIWAVSYNFIRIHKTLRVTPAMAADLSKVVMNWEDLIAFMDAEAPEPGPRGPYRKRGDENSNWPHYRAPRRPPTDHRSSYKQLGIASVLWRHDCPICSAAPSGQAPKPPLRRAQKGRDLTAKAQTELSFICATQMLPKIDARFPQRRDLAGRYAPV